LKKEMKNNDFRLNRDEEAFQPERVCNPYVQRMFQVCSTVFMYHFTRKSFCSLLHDVR
jgi:hypothetical protein